MAYLRWWRLTFAATLLRDTPDPGTSTEHHPTHPGSGAGGSARSQEADSVPSGEDEDVTGPGYGAGER